MVAPTSFFADYGCHVRILEEARVLQRLGHQVVICTYRNGQDLPDLTMRRTMPIPFREQHEVGSSPHKIALDFLLFWTVLFEALRRRPDVIHGHLHEGALIGLIVGRLLRIPLVFDFQGSMTAEMIDHHFLSRSSLFYRPLHWLETRIDRLSPAIVTSSQHAADLLVRQFDCRPERVRVMADCVDAETFRPPDEAERAGLAERRSALGIPPGRRLVVYLGLLAEYQGTDALLQAAARVVQERDDVHFLIMGYPAVDCYRQQARQLGLGERATFTGKIPYHQARDFLALGDVAVAPKLSATEGSGKILNYMALGLPTVAFDTPVSREYLRQEGIYARRADPAALAAGLLAALSEEPAASVRRGARLRRMVVEGYSWSRAAGIMIGTYDSLCRTPAGVAPQPGSAQIKPAGRGDGGE